MRGLFTELELSPGSEVEISACGVKLSDARRTFFDEHLDRRSIA
jgi:hypothetical protein